MVLQSLSENPVARAEHVHQQRGMIRLRGRRFPIVFGLALVVVVISTAGLLIKPQIGAILNLTPLEVEHMLNDWFGTLVVILGALVMIHHLSVALIGLQLASSAIAREKQGRTWESLLLTGIDARQIVLGKWWATQQTLWTAYRPLLPLRFVAVLWLGIFSEVGSVRPFFTPPSLVNVLALGVIVAIFPLGYAGFTATIGLLASLITGSEASAHRLARALFGLSLAVSLSMTVLIFMLPLGIWETSTASIVPALFITPLDGGMLPMIGMIASSDLSSAGYITGLLLCVALYAGLTLILLRSAQILAVRQRALVPSKLAVGRV